jgi:hypothetical protein
MEKKTICAKKIIMEGYSMLVWVAVLALLLVQKSMPNIGSGARFCD